MGFTQQNMPIVKQLPVDRYKWDTNRNTLFLPRAASDITVRDGSIVSDNTILFSGGSTVKFTSVNNAFVTGTINVSTLDLSSVDVFDVYFYADVYENIDDIIISFWNVYPPSGTVVAYKDITETNTLDNASGVKDSGWRFARITKQMLWGHAALDWASVKSLRIAIRSKIGTTVNVNLGLIATAQLSKGVVYMDFDDGTASQYGTAFPVMNSNDLKGNLNIITSFVGTGSYMTWPQILEMRNAGWAINSHTHTHQSLNSLTEAQLHTEFQATQLAMRSHDLDLGALILIAPLGEWSETVALIAKEYFKVCRTASASALNYYPTGFPQSHNMWQRYYSVQPTDTPATIQAAIDDAILKKGELVLNFHAIGAAGYAQADFVTVCEYLKSKIDAGTLLVPTRYDVFLQSKNIEALDLDGKVFASSVNGRLVTVDLR